MSDQSTERLFVVPQALPRGPSCVAPTYPAWASSEDGDAFWVRRDLAHRADALARSAGLLAPPSDFFPRGIALAEAGSVAMWLDRGQTDAWDDWCLREVEANADEAVMYVAYDVDEPLEEEVA